MNEPSAIDEFGFAVARDVSTRLVDLFPANEGQLNFYIANTIFWGIRVLTDPDSPAVRGARMNLRGSAIAVAALLKEEKEETDG